MKDKDQKKLWESYSTHRSKLTEAAGDGGAEARYDEPYRQAEREKFNNPHHRELQQRMQAKHDAPESPDGWTNEGLEEMEPAELVEFINEALPKFLQTNFETETYDEVQKALFNAAYTINWNSQPAEAEAAGEGGAEDRYDEPYRQKERKKFNNPHHRQLQQKMQSQHDAQR